MRWQSNNVYIGLAAFHVLWGVREAAGKTIIASDLLPGDSIIMFETGTVATPVIAGLHFSGGDDSFSNSFAIGKQYFGNFESVSFSYLDIVFDIPAFDIGAYLVRVNSGSPTAVTMVAKDSLGNTIESTTVNMPAFAQAGSSHPFIGLEESSGISTIEWQYDSPGFFGVDNVTYSLVPEPAGALGLLPLAALMLRRRRGCVR